MPWYTTTQIPLNGLSYVKIKIGNTIINQCVVQRVHYSREKTAKREQPTVYFIKVPLWNNQVTPESRQWIRRYTSTHVFIYFYGQPIHFEQHICPFCDYVFLILQRRTTRDVSAPGHSLWIFDWTFYLRTLLYVKFRFSTRIFYRGYILCIW